MQGVRVMTADAGHAEEGMSGGDGNGARAVVVDVVDLAARYASIVNALLTRLQGSCKALSRRDL
jgi:hypothetical protein